MDDYEKQEFLERLEELRKRSEAAIFSEIVEKTKLDEHSTPMYLPNTHHPKYTKNVSFVVSSNLHTVKIPEAVNCDIFVEQDPKFGLSSGLSVTILQRHTFYAPAPATGIPGELPVYVWHVWMDNLNRHIASPATLTYP